MRELFLISILLFGSHDLFAQEVTTEVGAGMRAEAIWQKSDLGIREEKTDDLRVGTHAYAEHQTKWRTSTVAESLRGVYTKSVKQNLENERDSLVFNGEVSLDKAFDRHYHKLSLTSTWGRYRGSTSRELTLLGTFDEEEKVTFRSLGASVLNSLVLTDTTSVFLTTWVNRFSSDKITLLYGGALGFSVEHSARLRSVTQLTVQEQKREIEGERLKTDILGASARLTYDWTASSDISAWLGQSVVISTDNERELLDIYGLGYTHTTPKDLDRITLRRSIRDRDGSDELYDSRNGELSRVRRMSLHHEVEVELSYAHDKLLREEQGVYEDILGAFTAYRYHFGRRLPAVEGSLASTVTCDYRFDYILVEDNRFSRHTVGLGIDYIF